MSKIIRTEPNKILSKAVEYHGFVFVQGCTAKDTSQDVKGQTRQVLALIDEILRLRLDVFSRQTIFDRSCVTLLLCVVRDQDLSGWCSR